jgi:hypothetical protein
VPKPRIPADPVASLERLIDKIKSSNPKYVVHINRFLQRRRLPDGRSPHDDNVVLDLREMLRELKKAARKPPDKRRPRR